MSKYIDAEKLIAKIERRKNESRELAQEHKNSSLGNAAQTMANEDEEILSLIASLQKEQPSLPSNLDEAAEEYSKQAFNGLLVVDNIDAFKAGAEWMAGQGVTKEAVIGIATEEISINISQKTLDELDLCPGDKVIVQIRKK